MPDESAPLPPDSLLAGRYRRESLLGQGGMGRVWRGTDELLGREIAVKELLLPVGLPEKDTMELRSRMMREARTAARLSHASIVTIYDVVEADERPWIIMELVRAPSLAELIRDRGGSLPAEEVARYARQLLEALSVAHGGGVVHRDVKPGNVLVTDTGRAVLTDFGIALHEGDSSLTRTGVLVGSPAYIAPEVARGQPAGPASDLWSLGTTLHAALSGQSPFQRDHPLATLTAIITEDPPPAPDAGPLLPVIEGLLRKDPERRLRAAEADALLRGTQRPSQQPPASAPATIPDAAALPGSPAPRRRSLTWGAAAAGAALAAAAVVLVLTLPPGGGSTGPAAPTAEGAAPEPSSEDEEGEDSGEDPDGGAPPAGMTLHEDETGFALHVPEDWSVRREGSSVYFDHPGGGYLQVDQTDSPGQDAKEDWENLEGAVAGNFSDYDRVAIEYVDTEGMDRYITAADWQFTHSSASNGPMRVVNRGFHTEEYGYAILLNLPEETWQDDGWDLLAEFSRSFEPAG